MRERLRAHRNQLKAGLGERSAGLLSGYLISEILRRAAEGGDPAFTLQEFRQCLLVDGEELARVAGTRDWGLVVGAMPAIPDVARPSVLAELASVFSSPDSRRVRRAVLVGLSGIGKSSLAAGYIGDRADSYDLVFWVNGETETTLIASFRQIIETIRGTNPLASHHGEASGLRAAVHTEVSKIFGRWAMIFDNVSNPRLVEPWIPVLGRGDVIITSIDSATPYGAASVINVGAMEVTEAVELLARRLDLDEIDRRRHDRQLVELARELEWWPLALELAAGYMNSCGIQLSRLDNYIDILKVRAVSDSSSLPPGYPRTLSAAVRMNLEQLMSEPEGAGEDSMGQLAFSVLALAAYLAPRQIPVDLIAISAVLDLSDIAGESGHALHRGPIKLDSASFNAGEVIRELRRYSLVTHDNEVPATIGDVMADGEPAISVNSIVQEVVRAGTDGWSETPAGLERLAFHVERWLAGALELGELARVYIMFTHADALVIHLMRLQIFNAHVGLLWGNLAMAYLAQGNAGRADTLLRAEVELFTSGVADNELLVVQAKLTLVNILLERPSASSLRDSDALPYLEHVLRFAQAVANDHPPAAVKLAVDALAVLALPRIKEVGSSDFEVLRNVFADLKSMLEATPYSRAVDDCSHASRLIARGEAREAEALCRGAIQANILNGSAELEAWRLLIEALVHQRNWRAADVELGRLIDRFGATRWMPHVVSALVHNVGYVCAMFSLLEGDDRACGLLDRIMEWPAVPRAVEVSSAGRHNRVRLLAAVRDISKGHYQRAEVALNSLQIEDMDDDGNQRELEGWRKLWELAKLVLFQHAHSSRLD